MKVLVTGAYSGIGYKLGCGLARSGHVVYMTTETDEQLNELRKKIKDEMVEVHTFKMDISTDDILLVDDLEIDCLINQAGVGLGGSILYMDIEVLRNNYEVNVFASFNLLKRVYHNMVERGVKGKLFVTSSVAAYLPFPFLGCYTSSKAAISALCRSIRKELEYLDNGITISVIEPGAYYTGFNQRMIESKNIYLNKDSLFYENRKSINRLQKNLFRFIERDNLDDLIEKVICEVDSEKPKFMIRCPWYISMLLKIYFLFWY